MSVQMDGLLYLFPPQKSECFQSEIFKEDTYNVMPFKNFKYKSTKIKALNVVTYVQKTLLLRIIRSNHKVRLSARVKSLSFTALV